MNSEPSKVLITNGSSRTSYAAMRSLSKKGIYCVSGDTVKHGMCQYSKYSKGSRIYTSHYKNEDAFISDLVKIVEDTKITTILPSHNETEIIARHRDKFKSDVLSLVPREEHCKVFNNKSLSYDLVESLNIPTPRRFLYEDLVGLEHLLKKEFVERVVIKLLTGNSAKGVFYANTSQEAIKIVQGLISKYNLQKDRYPQVEEHVDGIGYGHSVLFWNGELIAGFTHKRLRDKIETGGTSTYREAALNKHIEEASFKIMSSIGWHGLAMCEYKVCPNTNKFWFIEINPRMWGSLPLAVASGVDFPYLAFLCANKGPLHAKQFQLSKNISYGWKGKWLLGDIFINLKNLKKGRLRLFIKNIFFEKTNSYDDFYWNDPMVFIGEILAYLKKTISKKSTNPSEDGMLR